MLYFYAGDKKTARLVRKVFQFFKQTLLFINCEVVRVSIDVGKGTRRPDSHNNNRIPPRLLPLARPSLIKLQSSLLTILHCYTFHFYIRILGQIEMTG